MNTLPPYSTVVQAASEDGQWVVEIERYADTETGTLWLLKYDPIAVDAEGKPASIGAVSIRDITDNKGMIVARLVSKAQQLCEILGIDPQPLIDARDKEYETKRPVW